jgi:hypothetical protein
MVTFVIAIGIVRVGDVFRNAEIALLKADDRVGRHHDGIIGLEDGLLFVGGSA